MDEERLDDFEADIASASGMCPLATLFRLPKSHGFNSQRDSYWVRVKSQIVGPIYLKAKGGVYQR